MTDKTQEDTIKGRIIGLLRKGYTRSQLIMDFDFAERTVDSAVKAYRELGGNNCKEAKNDIRPDADGDSALPSTLKGTEVITPEGILQHCLRDGSRDWELRMEGMMLLRAAQKMNLDDVEIMKGQAEANAKMLKPVLEVMVEAAREQDAAAQRAKQSNMEIAETAAAGAAARAVMRIDEKFQELRQQKPDIAQSPDPMKGLMARTMEMVINQITGQIFGGQVGQTPGLVDKRDQGGE